MHPSVALTRISCSKCFSHQRSRSCIVTTDSVVYLLKYVVGFFLVDTKEIGERVSLSVEGVINKDEVSSFNL